jgi:hypothetical protein
MIPLKKAFFSFFALAAGLAFSCSPCFAQSAPRPAATTKKVAAKNRVRKVEAQPQVAPAPPPPPSPEQMPPQAPQVSYLNGQLTVISQNATLGDVLSAVQKQTGAVIDFPAGGATDRVAGRLGPGSPRDVLASLLNGSHFDYVMVGSNNNPGGVEHVILTPRANMPAGEPAANVAQAQPAAVQPAVPPDQQDQEAAEQQEVPVAEEPPPDESSPDQQAEQQQAEQQQQQQQAAQPDQQQIQPGVAPNQQQFPQPGVTPYGAQPGQPGYTGQPQNGQQVKTPEQLLEELQRMQQLQQQQQQEQQQQEHPQ